MAEAMAILEAIPGLWKNVILALDIAGYIFAFFLIPRIILERRHPSATLSWMLGIALLPLIGIPLYFLIGVRRIRRNIRAKIATVAPIASSLSHRLRPEELPTAIAERRGGGLMGAGVPAPATGSGPPPGCRSTQGDRGGRCGEPPAPCRRRAGRWRPSCRHSPSTAAGPPTRGTTGSPRCP